MRWVLGVPQSPSVAGRYGTDSAFCAMLVTLQSSIPCSVVETEKIASKGWETTSEMLRAHQETA